MELTQNEIEALRRKTVWKKEGDELKRLLTEDIKEFKENEH